MRYSEGFLTRGSYRSGSFEIIKLAAAKIDWKVEYFKCPWKRCLYEVKIGNLDMMGLLFKTPERKETMYYIEPPYNGERTAFYFLKGLGSNVREYKDLKGLTIGVLAGSKFYKPFDSDTTLDKYEVPFVDQKYKMLQAGRIDTFVADEFWYDADLKKSEFKDLFEKAPYRVLSGDYYFSISKKSPYAKDRFKFGEVLKQFIDSGKVKEIFNKHDYNWRPPTRQAPK